MGQPVIEVQCAATADPGATRFSHCTPAAQITVVSLEVSYASLEIG